MLGSHDIELTCTDIYGNRLTNAGQGMLYVKENKGGPINIGGIYGFAYNNSLVTNSKVELTNAIILGEKLSENDTVPKVGTNVGGIAGRFEHTGEINNTFNLSKGKWYGKFK